MKFLFSLRLPTVAGLAVFALAALEGCAPAESPEETSAPAEKARKSEVLAASYPMETELTNREGKVLKVTIIGRTEKEVLFLPDGENKEVRYPLAKLSKEDRRRVGAMPLGAGPKPDPPYVASRKKLLEENRRRIQEAEADLEGPSIINTSANQAAKKKKIEALEKENVLLEQQIRSYKGN